MTHGYQDFGLTNAPTTTYQTYDMGELAARLDSIDCYDRRGDVILLDDFEGTTLKWATNVVAVGSAAALSQTTAWRGDNSVALTAPDTINELVGIQRELYLPPLGKFGAEVRVATDDNIQSFTMGLLVATGATGYYYLFRYLVASTALQIYTTVGYVTIATVTLYGDSHLFHAIKVVCDTNTKYYVRLLVDDVEYDISAYQPFSFAWATSPYLAMAITVYSDGTDDQIVYFDDFILTQNEP